MAKRSEISLEHVANMWRSVWGDGELMRHHAMAQGMLDQNMSIDHVAEKMADDPENHYQVAGWRKQLIKAVTVGVLRA